MDDMNADCYLNVSDASPNNDFRKGKMVRDRLQGSASRTAEHSVSSQTLSPVHSNGKWVVVVVDGGGEGINWEHRCVNDFNATVLLFLFRFQPRPAQLQFQLDHIQPIRNQ